MENETVTVTRMPPEYYQDPQKWFDGRMSEIFKLMRSNLPDDDGRKDASPVAETQPAKKQECKPVF